MSKHNFVVSESKSTNFSAFNVESIVVKSKVVLNRAEFWTFIAFPNFKGAVPPKFCARVNMPIQRHIMW